MDEPNHPFEVGAVLWVWGLDALRDSVAWFHTHGACEGEQDRLFSREDQPITNLRVGDSKGAAYIMDGRGDFWLLRPGLPIDRAVGKVFSWNHWSREIETLNLHSVTIACCGGRVVLRCIRGCVCRRVA